MRNDDSFSMFYQTALRKSKKDSFIEKLALVREKIKSN